MLRMRAQHRSAAARKRCSAARHLDIEIALLDGSVPLGSEGDQLGIMPGSMPGIIIGNIGICVGAPCWGCS